MVRLLTSTGWSNKTITETAHEQGLSEEEQSLLEMFDITEEELPDLIEALEVIDDAVEEYRQELFAEAGLLKRMFPANKNQIKKQTTQDKPNYDDDPRDRRGYAAPKPNRETSRRIT